MPVSPVSSINADSRAETARAVAQQLEQAKSADRARQNSSDADRSTARSASDVTGAVVNTQG
jgi:hypothetical protein